MDGGDRRTAQYGQPYQHLGGRPAPGQSMGPPTTERYSQPSPAARSDPNRPVITRPYVPGYPAYGYQDQSYHPPSLQSSGPMQGVELQYPHAYVQNVSRPHQVGQSQIHHQYSSYPQGSILPSTPQQQLYDTIPPYQQRQSAAVEVMSSQLGTIPQYMPQSDQSALSMHSAPSHFMTSLAEQPSYSTTTVTRPALQSQYDSSPTGQEKTEAQASQPTAIDPEALEEGLRDFDLQLKRTFDAIIAGRLTDASDKLLTISRWMTDAVVPLGLHHDDEAKYEERLSRWRQLNLCWEALGQKQKDITEDARRTRRQPIDLLPVTKLQSMIDSLVAMCDRIEHHGLVDYEMGFAEEQITQIFSICIDLLPPDESGRRVTCALKPEIVWYLEQQRQDISG